MIFRFRSPPLSEMILQLWMIKAILPDLDSLYPHSWEYDEKTEIRTMNILINGAILYSLWIQP